MSRDPSQRPPRHRGLLVTVDGWRRDLRGGLRGLARRPGFTLLAVLTLALGIGANTAIFSVLDRVVLAPPPYPEPDQLVRVWELSSQGGTMNAAYPNFQDWRRRAGSFAALAAYGWGSTTVLGGDRPLVTGVAQVSEDFFTVLGVAPAHGRAPAVDEHREGVAPVAVVSHRFWQQQLGGREDAVGSRTVDVAGMVAEVVGVMPPGFAFPRRVDVWLPMELSPPSPYRTAHNVKVLGRLADGASLAAAEAELDAITATFTVEDFETDDYLAAGAQLATLQEEIAGPVRRPLSILLGAALLVLLVACANLGSAFLARATERRHEMAVRKSLGAGTGRLLAQLFGEGMVVSLLGAAAGLALGRALLAAVRSLAPAGVPGLAEVRLDGTLLAFTLLLSLATAVLFSLLPALSAVGRGVATGALRAGRTGSTGPGERRVWNLLVAAEVALALVLLVGSGLLLRSFWQLSEVETGFSAAGVLTADLHLPASHYPEDPEKAAYYRQLGERLAALPGVEAAGFINHLPLSGADANGRMEVEGGPEPTTDASYRVATAAYFSAMEIPLLAGRLFDGRDDATAPHVAVVNQALAEQAWPGESAVGKRMTGGGMDRFWDQEIWAEVVGVVGNVRHRGLDQPPRPEVYFHTLQRPPQSATAVVRAAGTPASMAAAVRRAATDLDDQVPLELAPMEEVMGRSLAQRRFTLLLLAAFAGLALLLTALGVYGVVSLSVSRRRRELGIRLALGARPGRVRGLVLSRAMAAVGLGLLAGLAGALALSRLLASLLFGVSPSDPPTFAAVAALLGAAALAASLVPAHRSSRIEPVEVIRAD